MRLLGLLNAPLLEDHDSVGLLLAGDAMARLDLPALHDLSLGLLPLYPALLALVHAVTGLPLELSARLTSLAASTGTAVIVTLLALRLAGPLAAWASLVLLAVEPNLARLGYAVLTEPTYCFLLWLGLYLFFTHARAPTLPMAACLGLVFGAAFLCRMEGILYLGALPVLVGVLARTGRDGASLRKVVAWAATFTLCFGAVAAPQVWRESRAMGRLALNAREVWSALLVAPDGRSFDQKIYGLDYSDGEIDVDAVAHDPALFYRIRSASSPAAYLRLVVRNLDPVTQDALPDLVGLPALLLVLPGILELVARGRGADTGLLLVFGLLEIAPPLLHNVVLRHLLPVAPVLLVLAGAGVTAVARALPRRSPRAGRLATPALMAGLALSLLAVHASRLRALAVLPDDVTADYDHATFTPFVRELQEPCAAPEAPRILTRKRYLPWFAGCDALPLPYTDLPGLRRFAALNGADYLFLDSAQDGDRPFLAGFSDWAAPPSGFVPVKRTTLAHGRELRLYRLVPGAEAPPL